MQVYARCKDGVPLYVGGMLRCKGFAWELLRIACVRRWLPGLPYFGVVICDCCLSELRTASTPIGFVVIRPLPIFSGLPTPHSLTNFQSGSRTIAISCSITVLLASIMNFFSLTVSYTSSPSSFLPITLGNRKLLIAVSVEHLPCQYTIIQAG